MNNREIDALVAEKVMGWKLSKQQIQANAWADVWRNEDEKIMAYHREWKPSTDISAAWRVVDRLIEVGLYPVIWVKPGIVQLYAHNEICNIEEKAAIPLAICLAALKAVGVEVPDGVN